MQTEQRAALDSLNGTYNELYAEKRKAVDNLLGAVHTGDARQIDQAISDLQGVDRD